MNSQVSSAAFGDLADIQRLAVLNSDPCPLGECLTVDGRQDRWPAQGNVSAGMKEQLWPRHGDLETFNSNIVMNQDIGDFEGYWIHWPGMAKAMSDMGPSGEVLNEV